MDALYYICVLFKSNYFMKNLNLLKIIDHNGVKFIPIVELAKIAGYEYKTVSWSGCMGASASYTQTFCYSAEFGFYISVVDSFYSSDEFRETEEIVEFNQYILFQQLIEWGFEIN